ncbi:MAG: DUF2914 domain-containing protein [Deltaproteobacteria bacterium]|nr:DUF2914 domain-containing protein [Deltaproteobacteria bacterium]
MVQSSRLLLIVATATMLAQSPNAWASGEEIGGEEAAAQPASETPTTGTAPAAESDVTPQPTESAAETDPSAQVPVAEPEATPAIQAGAEGHVALARFTTAVENREPVDAVTFLENDAALIYFYTDLRNLSGQTVTHRWELGGEVMAEVPFSVGSDRWRIWSSKRLRPDWAGDWTVAVVQGDGEVIASETFTLQPKLQPKPQP